MPEVPTVKRIYDWNRHTWIEVAVYSADRIGCYKSVPESLRPMRRVNPPTLRQRMCRYIRRRGPQTATALAKALLLSGENKSIVRIMWQLKRYPELFVVVGDKQTRGGKRKLWGIRE